LLPLAHPVQGGGVSDPERPATPLEQLSWPVRTERLLIRPIEAGDHPALYAIRARPEVARWLSGMPASYDAFVEEWAKPGRVDTTLSLEHDGRVVGDVFLRVTDAWGQREVVEEGRGTHGDIGWLVDPAYAGRGLATEAALEVLRICFEELGLHRVTAAAFAENVASVRVMEKIGMRLEGRGVREALHRDLGWVDGIHAGLLAEEWRRNRVDRTGVSGQGGRP
jgi:RimJ/RimL family protein N-acetyltransferase